MKTDAVVCARGERAKTIVPVVRALRKGAGGTVYLVDDGDNCGLWRARLAGARVIQGTHRGKATAMMTGLVHVRTSRVIFCDADITGFTAAHAARLADDNGGQICGLRDNGSSWLGPVPPITGERSLSWAVAYRSLQGATGYEAELAINAEVGKRGLRAETFVMRGCTNPSKEPLRRVGQMIRAAARYVLGLVQYSVAWCISLLAH